jgi:hypothetical protein
VHLYHEPRYRVQPSLQAQRSWWTIGKPKVRLRYPELENVGPTHTGRFAERRARADLRMMSRSAWRFTYLGTPQTCRLISFQCKPVFRDDLCVTQRLCKTGIGHVGRCKRPAIDSSMQYLRTVVYQLCCWSALYCIFGADLPIDMHLLFLVRCASQKLLYFLHAHRKKTKHSQGGGKSSPVPLHQAVDIPTPMVTALLLPKPVQDVTSIYNFCLVMRHVHRNRSRSG